MSTTPENIGAEIALFESILDEETRATAVAVYKHRSDSLLPEVYAGLAHQVAINYDDDTEAAVVAFDAASTLADHGEIDHTDFSPEDDDIIDSYVEQVQRLELGGVTLDQIADVLGVNLSLGASSGLLEISHRLAELEDENLNILQAMARDAQTGAHEEFIQPYEDEEETTEADVQLDVSIGEEEEEEEAEPEFDPISQAINDKLSVEAQLALFTLESLTYEYDVAGISLYDIAKVFSLDLESEKDLVVLAMRMQDADKFQRVDLKHFRDSARSTLSLGEQVLGHLGVSVESLEEAEENAAVSDTSVVKVDDEEFEL